MTHFLEMGGYAAYVWPAYGLFVIVFAANIILPLRREKQVVRALRRRRER